MRRLLIPLILAVLMLVMGFSYLMLRERKTSLSEAYVGERHAALWSGTAQVRQLVATLNYGEKVSVMQRVGSKTEIRARNSLTGWLDENQLILPDLWKRIGALAKQAQQMPAQAHGHTRALSNLHLEPGREATRIGQLPRDAPVEVLERAVAAPAVQPGSPGKKEAAAKEEPAASRHEGWLLVRTQPKDQPEQAGWLLSRFVQYELPAPLPEYATAAGIRVVAWFELNQISDPRLGPKPQYLVAGAKGPEDQACDFTMLRVYTWGEKRERYETAYVENNLCGRLPVRVASQRNGDVLFRFAVAGDGASEELNYRMRSTIVRRVGREKAKAKGKGKK